MNDESEPRESIRPLEPEGPDPGIEPDEITPGSTFPVRRVILWASLAIFVAAAGFGVYTAFMKAKSPEQVTLGLFESLSERDLLGTAASLLPDERDILVQPVLDLLSEAQRLGVLEETDLENVPGFTLEFTDLEIEIEEVADDLVWATVTGSVTSSGNPQEIPLGPLVRRYLPDDWEAAALPTDPVTEDMGSDFGLALVEDGGRWYVSLLHTAAEAARRDAGLPLPSVAPFPEPAGAASPEEALERAALALVGVDLRGFVDVVRPGESLAFRRYAGLFMDDWDSAIAEFEAAMADAGFAYSIDEVAAESATVGDETVAWITDIPRFSASLDVPDAGRLAVSRADGCITGVAPEGLIDELGPLLGIDLDAGQFDGETCLNDIDLGLDTLLGTDRVTADEQADVLYGMPIAGRLFERWFPPLPDEADPEPFHVQFVVVEEDGRWYVSLTRTFTRWSLAFTSTLDMDLLIAVGDDIQQSVEDPEAFAARMEEWAMAAAEAGFAGGLFPPGLIGPDVPPDGPSGFDRFAGRQLVVMVWEPDLTVLRTAIELEHGPGTVLAAVTAEDLHAAFIRSFGPDGAFGLPPSEFPGGLVLGPLELSQVEEVWLRFEVLDLYLAEDLGLTQP